MRGKEKLYKVGHHGASIHKCSCGISPLYTINHVAIVLNQCPFEDLVVLTEETSRACPVIAFSSPVGVCLVSRVPSQPSCKLEERPGRYSIFVVVSFIEGEYLPAKAPATGSCIPAGCLVVENVDSEFEPGW